MCTETQKVKQIFTDDPIMALESLTAKKMCERLNKITGRKIKSNNKPYLLKQLIKALQNKNDQNTKAVSDEGITNAFHSVQKDKSHDSIKQEKMRDSRLPEPGTILERDYDGKKIRATVLEEGFKYQGKIYRSLSAIAKEISNCSWNGFLFFRLIPYVRRHVAEK